jgi:hypothetical protein
MKNPAEEIAIAWLQECKGYFTMNNIKIHKQAGGMGTEIYILATNKKKNIWIEVSVSTNPRCCYKKEIRFAETINFYHRDFKRKDKIKKVKEYLGSNFETWLIHGKLALTKEEKKKFPMVLKKHGVFAYYFGYVWMVTKNQEGKNYDD